jgi:hypothetical protein
MATARTEIDGHRIVLDFDNLEDALQLLSPWRGAVIRAEVAENMHKALSAVGLTLEVRAKGCPVAELGEGQFRGSLLALLKAAL